MSNIIADSKGKPILFSVKRDDTEIELRIKPELKPNLNEFGESVGRYLVGISPQTNISVPSGSGLLKPLVKAFYTYNLSRIMIIGIVKLIKRDISAKNLGVPS